MQNHISTNNTNNGSDWYPVLNLFEAKRIKAQVNNIHDNWIYTVTDISPNAQCSEHDYNGQYLKYHSDEILGTVPVRHGFIVKKRWENGWKDTIIFVYTGPITHVVNKILETTH